MNPRHLVARTVILVLSDVESLKGTVSPDSTRTAFVLERPVHLSPAPDGTTREADVDGTAHVAADRPVWVQVV